MARLEVCFVEKFTNSLFRVFLLVFISNSELPFQFFYQILPRC
jgi:hypothetical protein